MRHFEYNDLNKFIVSVGIFLIGLTFFLPWLFLKENFDLLIRAEELNKLTPIAKDIVQNRQALIGTYSLIIPVISLASFILGTFLVFKGIGGWRKLQIILEAREELTNKKLSLEIVKLSEAEKLEKVSKDIEMSQQSNSIEETKKGQETTLTTAQQYLKAEKVFGELVRKAFGDKYKIYQDFRIDRNEFDLLLKAPLLFDKDVIFEVKYSSSRVGGQYFYQSLQQLKNVLAYYRQNIKDRTAGRLVFIMPSEAAKAKSKQPDSLYENTLYLIDIANRANKGEGIHICFLDFNKLEAYTSEEIVLLLKL